MAKKPLIIQKICNMAHSNRNTPFIPISYSKIVKKHLLQEVHISGYCGSQRGAHRLLDKTDVSRNNACSVLSSMAGCV